MAGLFFLRFFRATKDRLFVLFGVAFWLLSANFVAVGVIHPAEESRHYVYIVRLIAFLLVLAAVIDKNRRR